MGFVMMTSYEARNRTSLIKNNNLFRKEEYAFSFSLFISLSQGCSDLSCGLMSDYSCRFVFIFIFFSLGHSTSISF